jgi:hypothetical protein
MVYNPLTCSGWDASAGWFASGGCLSARLGIVVLFFIIALMRKWVFGSLGIPYNFVLGTIVSMLAYLITIIIFGSFKWALLIGIVAAIAGGMLLGVVFGETDND